MLTNLNYFNEQMLIKRHSESCIYFWSTEGWETPEKSLKDKSILDSSETEKCFVTWHELQSAKARSCICSILNPEIWKFLQVPKSQSQTKKFWSSSEHFTGTLWLEWIWHLDYFDATQGVVVGTMKLKKK